MVQNSLLTFSPWGGESQNLSQLPHCLKSSFLPHFKGQDLGSIHLPETSSRIRPSLQSHPASLELCLFLSLKNSWMYFCEKIYFNPFFTNLKTNFLFRLTGLWAKIFTRFENFVFRANYRENRKIFWRETLRLSSTFVLFFIPELVFRTFTSTRTSKGGDPKANFVFTTILKTIDTVLPDSPSWFTLIFAPLFAVFYTFSLDVRSFWFSFANTSVLKMIILKWYIEIS